jgi:hypothetical protein
VFSDAAIEIDIEVRVVRRRPRSHRAATYAVRLMTDLLGRKCSISLARSERTPPTDEDDCVVVEVSAFEPAVA